MIIIIIQLTNLKSPHFVNVFAKLRNKLKILIYQIEKFPHFIAIFSSRVKIRLPRGSLREVQVIHFAVSFP